MFVRVHARVERLYSHVEDGLCIILCLIRRMDFNESLRGFVCSWHARESAEDQEACVSSHVKRMVWQTYYPSGIVFKVPK